ncbi:hypothetical protein [Roseimaritima sediminicola]|uniref:hypothetical protein n=1 Tax=Roseimaritima sediminicola TaxID=2662066 RepID=UPI0012983CF8|nr:hypothetical protein [Roseimaritima sediminicola]
MTELGRAICSVDEGTPAIEVVAVGGAEGVQVGLTHGESHCTLRLRDASGEPLPSIADSYARHKDYVAHLAQSENDAFGVTVQTRLIDAGEPATIVECVVEMQTRMLDSRPALWLDAVDAELVDRRQQGMLLRVGGLHLGVLLTARDRNSCRFESAQVGAVRLRLFGGFLEKGVIQKCRLWLVAWGAEEPTANQWAEAVEQLANAPLPLTT